jgi:hypothetical protein
MPKLTLSCSAEGKEGSIYYVVMSGGKARRNETIKNT